MDRLTNEQLVGLILRVQSGDEEAFNTLVVQYTPLMHAVIRKLSLPVYESFSEACLGLYNAARTFNVGQDGVTFGLYARILITRRLYALSPSGEDATDHLSDLNIDEIAVSDGIVSRLERKEQMEEFLLRCRSLLSKYEYSVFILWLEGCKTAQIAEELDSDAKSVDNAKNRIRKKLRDEFFVGN